MLKMTAKNYLKLFFKNTSSDYASVEEIYAAADRTNEPEDKNKQWLGNKALYMRKEHGLIETVFAAKHGSAPAKISGYRLTDKGLLLLGRIRRNADDAGTPPPSLFDKKEDHNGFRSTDKEISLEDVMKLIPKLKQEHPEFEITFDVRLKNG